MPEQEKTAAPAPLPGADEGGRSGLLPNTARSDLQRRASLRWAIAIGAMGAAGAAAFNLLLFFQSGAWQMLGVAAGSAVAIVCLAPAWRLGHRGRFDAAAYWTLGGMFLAFAAGELLHDGLTLFLATGGILLALVVGNLLLPHKRWLWVAAATLYAAYTVLINWWEPLPRYEMQQLGALSDIFVAGLMAFLVIAALYAIIRAYRLIATIRTRLTVSFVMVALLPVIAIGVAAGCFRPTGGGSADCRPVGAGRRPQRSRDRLLGERSTNRPEHHPVGRAGDVEPEHLEPGSGGLGGLSTSNRKAARAFWAGAGTDGAPRGNVLPGQRGHRSWFPQIPPRTVSDSQQPTLLPRGTEGSQHSAALATR